MKKEKQMKGENAMNKNVMKQKLKSKLKDSKRNNINSTCCNNNNTSNLSNSKCKCIV